MPVSKFAFRMQPAALHRGGGSGRALTSHAGTNSAGLPGEGGSDGLLTGARWGSAG